MSHQLLIIFDCDGTLVDSEGLANRVFVEGVNKLGAPLTMEEAWAHFPGTSLSLCMDYVERKFDFIFPTGFIDEHRAQQKEVFAQELTLIPGIKEVLEQLQHCSMCVASNGPDDVIRANLRTTQIFDYFNNAIFSAYNLEKWKPDPSLFLHAAQSMGFEPKECIVIEDSNAGIEAGIRAGMTVLAYLPSNDHPIIDGHQPAHIFNDMSELPSLISKKIDATALSS